MQENSAIANSAVTKSPVDAALLEQSEQISMIHDVITTLWARLESVTVPKPLNSKENDVPESRYSVSGRVEDSNRAIRYARERLLQIIDELEV